MKPTHADRFRLLPTVWVAALALAAMPARAADFYWTNNTTAGNFTNAANWAPGFSTVPGPDDQAHFTNNASPTVNWTSVTTTSNALFNAQSGIVSLNIGSGGWQLTDRMVVGQLPGTTAIVYHTSGSLVITNADGTGTLVVGEAGRGGFFLRGGTTTVDRLVSTNSIGATSNSFVRIDQGVLHTRGGATILQGSNGFAISAADLGGTAAWYVSGGDNLVDTKGFAFSIGVGGGRQGMLHISGPNTTFTNLGGVIIGLNGGAASMLTISNGAKARFGSFTTGYNSANSHSTRLIVTGPGSLLSVVGGATIGHVGSLNRMQVSDGARAEFGGLITVGDHQVSSDNELIVSGSNSLLKVEGGLFIGLSSRNSRLFVENGGTLISTGNTWSLVVGLNSTSTNAFASISGAGSLVSAQRAYVGASIYGGDGGPYSRLVLTDSGMLEISDRIIVGSLSTMTNVGGVLQFTLASPLITRGGGILLSNATLSFRGINNANVFGNVVGAANQLTNITFGGANTWRLHTASNASGVAFYQFDTGFGSTNFVGLQLAGTGALWRSTALRIGSGGSLTGNGTVAANTTNAGLIAPGFSPGLLTFSSNVVFEPSALLQIEIGGTNVVDYDRLIVAGNLTLTGTLQVTSLQGYAAPVGTLYTIIDGAVPSSGHFTGLTNGAFVDASSSYYHIYYNYNGNDVVLIATIPEPSALAMILLAMAAAAFGRRHRPG